MKIFNLPGTKILRSDDYNMIFTKWKDPTTQIPDGNLLRWGKTPEDDPTFSPFGGEIADIEISAGKCPGIRRADGKMIGCSFCYKGNSPNQPLENMSLATFKTVLDKLLDQSPLTQVALGLTGVKDNPDLISIMRYCREKEVFPNFTLTGADLDFETAEQLSEFCGGLAVSCSETNPDLCFDTVKLFTDLGVEQVNIHLVVSKETVPFVFEVLKARETDPRLKDMRAVVLLAIKPKGRATHNFHTASSKQYQEIIDYALSRNIPLGFDSCSCAHFLNSISRRPDYKAIESMTDSCESTLFSVYVNVKGQFFPCSFAEGTPGWEDGLDVVTCNNFIQDIWLHPRTVEFREKLIASANNKLNCRQCPLYPQLHIQDFK